MPADSFASMFFYRIFLWVPLVIVWGYGLLKARKLTGKYAGVGRKAMIAFSGFIASIVINNLVFAYVSSAPDNVQVVSIMSVLNVLSVVASVILWLFVIGAIFDERDKGAKMPDDNLFAN